MIFAVKKRTLIIILVVILALVGGIVATTLIVRARAAANLNGKTIVVDAGHGGIDGGVVGRDSGVTEASINLAISLQLADLLKGKGYTVILTRRNENGLYGNNRNNRKLADMEARKRIINNSNADLVVSIHQNAFPDRSVRGATVFHSIAAPETTISIAATMQASFNEALSQDKQAKPGDFFILAASSFPSLLIECGFLSNSEDEALLQTPEHQALIASTIANTIDAIFFPPTET